MRHIEKTTFFDIIFFTELFFYLVEIDPFGSCSHSLANRMLIMNLSRVIIENKNSVARVFCIIPIFYKFLLNVSTLLMNNNHLPLCPEFLGH